MLLKYEDEAHCQLHHRKVEPPGDSLSICLLSGSPVSELLSPLPLARYIPSVTIWASQKEATVSSLISLRLGNLTEIWGGSGFAIICSDKKHHPEVDTEHSKFCARLQKQDCCWIIKGFANRKVGKLTCPAKIPQATLSKHAMILYPVHSNSETITRISSSHVPMSKSTNAHNWHAFRGRTRYQKM